MWKLTSQVSGLVQGFAGAPVQGKTPQAPRFAPVINALENTFESLRESTVDRRGSPAFKQFSDGAMHALDFADRISDPGAKISAFQRLRMFCARSLLSAPHWLKPPLTELGMFVSNRDLRRLDELSAAMAAPHQPSARRDLRALQNEVSHMRDHSTAPLVRSRASRFLAELRAQQVSDAPTPLVDLTPAEGTAAKNAMLAPGSTGASLRRNGALRAPTKTPRRASDVGPQLTYQPAHDAPLGRSKSDVFAPVGMTVDVLQIVIEPAKDSAPQGDPPIATQPAGETLQISNTQAKVSALQVAPPPPAGDTLQVSKAETKPSRPTASGAPTVPARPKRKKKIRASDIKHLGLSKGLHVRELTTYGRHRVRYTISNSYRQGGFGKFRYCIGPDGTAYAIKEFRSEFAQVKTEEGLDENGKLVTRAKTKNKHGQWLTSVTSLEKIEEEIKRIQQSGTNFKVHD